MCRQRRDDGVAGKKTVFLRHLHTKYIILPRQARDRQTQGKHSKKSGIFPQAESLPNTKDAGRDFNLLTNAFTICQVRKKRAFHFHLAGTTILRATMSCQDRLGTTKKGEI